MDLLNLLRLSRAKPFKSPSHLVLSEHFLPHGWHGNSPETQNAYDAGAYGLFFPTLLQPGHGNGMQWLQDTQKECLGLVLINRQRSLSRP